MTFPNRITRADLGPHMNDEKRVVDPRAELGADVINLMGWQAAGMSRVTPLVVFNYRAGVTDYMLAAWSTTQHGYRDTAGAPAAANLVDANGIDTVTVLGDNRVEVQFDDQVTDMAGNLRDLNFTFATCTTPNSTILKGSAVVSAGPGGRTNLITMGVHSAAVFVAGEMTVRVW